MTGMAKELRRKSQIAWGLCLICLLFLLETWNADRAMPNPASPLVWAVLGTLAAVCLVLALWLGRRVRQAPPSE
jgi:peptidoglycan/LPS O-acetylase OafA/YrhL